jgi:hypothetical protein
MVLIYGLLLWPIVYGELFLQLIYVLSALYVPSFILSVNWENQKIPLINRENPSEKQIKF